MKEPTILPITLEATRALLLAAALAGMATPRASAIMANPAPGEFIQPDGTKITLRLRGDEFFHWQEDLQGHTVVRDGARFVYGKLDAQKHLVPTPWEVGKVDPRAVGLSRRILPPPELRPANRNSLRPLRQPGANAVAPATAAQPPATTPSPDPFSPASAGAGGVLKNLVILCKFSDHVWGVHTRDRADYDALFNAIGGQQTLAPSGSVRDFYAQASYGQMTLESTVVAWVELPQPESYYVGSDNGMGVYPHNAQRMVEDALRLADPLVDFSQFDMDGDGYVDAITIIHSGYGAEHDQSPSRIWSHKGNLNGTWFSTERNASGAPVGVFNYHTEPALWGTGGNAITRIGVICHELGHFRGLPDLYDTDHDSSGIGAYCLMAYSWGFDNSQYHPPLPSAWCRVQLGWVTPTILTEPNLYGLPQVATTPAVFQITYGFPQGEYLLIENRQPVGFDGLIPQGGLAIWHIDENMPDNREQGYPGQFDWPRRHYRVALLQADGRYDLEEHDNNIGDASDLYRAGGQDWIGPHSNPATDSYSLGLFTVTDNRLEGIGNPGPTMTFWYLQTPAIWVDPFYTGWLEFGSLTYPAKSFADGYRFAQDGETLFLRAGYYAIAPFTLNRRLTVRSWGGPATLGR